MVHLIRVDYSFKAIKVFSRIENIFDKYYEVLDGYPGAPRTWTIGVGYEFSN
ncbi:MAG: TonB-dependent receptor [Desulfobacterales bacterium]|nr:TonB-dependent receptor [Desulfobacterales bacterium]